MLVNKGDRVCFTYYGEDENEKIEVGTVTSTFYEPGDPIMGVNVVNDHGQNFGGLDSQDVYPEYMYVKILATLVKW